MLVLHSTKQALIEHEEFDNNLVFLQGLANAAQATADAAQALAAAGLSAQDVDTRIQAVIGTAPTALDTLGEIAAQLASDETAAAALTTQMAGKASLTADNALSGVQSFGKAVFQKSAGVLAANNIDVTLGSHYKKTIVANTALTVSNVPASGNVVAFILDLINGGAFTTTFWANMTWAGGTVPTFTAAGRDTLGFFTADGGASWTGMMIVKDAK